MKKYSIYSFVFIIVVLLALASCVNPLEKANWVGDEMIDVRFRVRTSDALPQTKALSERILSGTRGEAVDFMNMYCFDSNGRYIGRYPANIETLGLEGTFSGSVPTGTKRIHFIANVDRPIGNDKIGYTEEQLFFGDDEEGRLWGLTDCARDKIAYWGYLKKDEGEVFDQDEIIYLIPDRALLISGNCTDTKIASLQWTLYNGKSFGFIAPHPFDTQYWGITETIDDESITTLIPNAPLTPHNNPARDMSDDDDELDSWASEAAHWRDFPKVYSATTFTQLFVFEDKNELNPNYTPPTKEMPRVIIKATFTDGAVRYFPIRLTKEDGTTSLELHRGHSYQLNLDYLPEVMGKEYFHEAAKATSFANGQLVDIPSEVAEVSDGKFSLKVVYELGEDKNISTSAVFQSRPNDGIVQIPFEFLTFPAGLKPTSEELSNWSFTAQWLNNPTNNVASSTISVITTEGEGENQINLLSNDGRGFVEITLNEITSSLKSGVISLKANYEKTEGEGEDAKTTRYSLERYIYVYSIKEFTLDGTPSLTKSDDGTYYRLSFKLPSTNAYPAGLYPLKVMFASKTLQPYRAYNVVGSTLTPDTGIVFGVDNRSTKPGEVAGISQPTGDNANQQWNYQEPDKPWNFWYVYTIFTKKEGDLYYIDFKDISNSYAGQTIANLGLYLKIEFFGDAQAVSCNK